MRNSGRDICLHQLRLSLTLYTEHSHTHTARQTHTHTVFNTFNLTVCESVCASLSVCLRSVVTETGYEETLSSLALSRLFSLPVSHSRIMWTRKTFKDAYVYCFLGFKGVSYPSVKPQNPTFSSVKQSGLALWNGIWITVWYFLGHLEDITVLICFPVCLTLFKRHFKCWKCTDM